MKHGDVFSRRCYLFKNTYRSISKTDVVYVTISVSFFCPKPILLCSRRLLPILDMYACFTGSFWIRTPRVNNVTVHLNTQPYKLRFSSRARPTKWLQIDFSPPLYLRCHISIRKRLHLDFYFWKKSVPCTYENIIIFRCRRILVVVENVGKSPYELDLIKNVLGAEEWREKKKRFRRKSDPAYIILNVLFSRCACFYFINFIRRPLRIRTTAISLKQILPPRGEEVVKISLFTT